MQLFWGGKVLAGLHLVDILTVLTSCEIRAYRHVPPRPPFKGQVRQTSLLKDYCRDISDRVRFAIWTLPFGGCSSPPRHRDPRQRPERFLESRKIWPFQGFKERENELVPNGQKETFFFFGIQGGPEIFY